jgi:membrane fusion protein (multidrug efflux system)
MRVDIHGESGPARARAGSAAAWALAGGVSLVLAAAACGSGTANATEDGTADGGAGYVKVVNVVTSSIEPSDFTSWVRITAEARADDDVTVSAQESGVIVRFFAEKGERLARGAPIAKIDDAVLRAQVEEARAAADLAHERFLRQEQLWEVEKIGSEITYLQTKYDADQARARSEQLEARLARTTIRAPVAGVLDDRFVEAGEIVSPGTRVARVIDASRLEVTGGVPERFGSFVREGETAVITFDVVPGRTFEGRISYVGAAIDPRSRTFPIEIVMENPDGLVKPQMIANVRVATERLEDVIVVPRDVLIRTENGYQAFVVAGPAGEEVAEARDVTLGASFENRIVVTGGLEPGDRLVVRGQQLVDPGDRVEIVDGEGA